MAVAASSDVTRQVVQPSLDPDEFTVKRGQGGFPTISKDSNSQEFQAHQRSNGLSSSEAVE